MVLRQMSRRREISSADLCDTSYHGHRSDVKNLFVQNLFLQGSVLYVRESLRLLCDVSETVSSQASTRSRCSGFEVQTKTADNSGSPVILCVAEPGLDSSFSAVMLAPVSPKF